MHFHPSSPFLCTFLTLISLSPPPSPSTTTWGSHLYLKAWRRLVNQGIVPFQVLPWCFVDPRNCRTDKRVPDPFEKDPSWWGGRKWAEGGRDDLKVRPQLICILSFDDKRFRARRTDLLSSLSTADASPLAVERKRLIGKPTEASSLFISTTSGTKISLPPVGSERFCWNRWMPCSSLV
jgi:hypothetical protein